MTYFLRRRFHSLLLLAALALAASIASAQEQDAPPPIIPDPASSELRLQAASSAYDEQTGSFTAEGGVSVTYGSMRFEAARVIVNRASSTITVPGQLTLFRGAETFNGENLSFNYSEETGTLESACGCMSGVNIKGERLDFFKDRLMFHNAVFSTCSLDNMDYHISAKTLEITPERKLVFRKLGFYMWNRRLLKWGKFSSELGSNANSPDGSKAPAKKSKYLAGFKFSPPAAGYSDLGGLHVRAGLSKKITQVTSLNLRTSYYLSEGFFPEIEARRSGRTTQWARFGKQFKENTGYFRYAGPVSVWNLPTAGINLGDRETLGGRLKYTVSAEAGRLKEKQNPGPRNRAFARLYARYPLNPERRVTFSLVSEGRYAVYTGWKKYLVFGSGVAAETKLTPRQNLSLEYLRFSDKGRTPFYSDLVNTNDRLFGLITSKISNRTVAHIDMEYDLNRSVMNEVEYGLTRTYNCIRVDAGWRKELKSIYFRLNILGLDSAKNKPESHKK